MAEGDHDRQEIRPALKPAAEGTSLVVCNTCRSANQGHHPDPGRADGARLAGSLRRMRAMHAQFAGIAIEEMSCLFACDQGCTVHLRGPGRISYVMGRFTPGESAARAILDFALHYSRSAHGEVDFGLWPEGVKGHFITRAPPPGFLVP